jgi:hypothetical protein
MKTNFSPLRAFVATCVQTFVQGFAKGARETPRAFFAPALAVWRLLLSTTQELIRRPN